MEIHPPAHARQEQSHPLSNIFLVLGGLFLAVGSTLDVAIHHDSAMSNPHVRRYVANHISQFAASHSGNFELAAAMSIIITAGKKILTRSQIVPGSDNSYDRLVHHGSLVAFAGALALVALIEGYPQNTEFVEDMSVTVLAMLTGFGVTNEVMHRLRQSRDQLIRPHAKGLHFLASTPTSLDEIFSTQPDLFHSTATSADQLFA